MTKKFYQTLNQTPRSARDHGQYRRAPSSSHRHSADGASDSPGGAASNILSFGSGAGMVYTSGSSGISPWSILSPADPKPIPYAGIRTPGEIIGHRLWWVIEEDGQPWLCSLAHRRLWQPGETVEGDINQLINPGSYPPLFGGVYSFMSIEQMPTEIAEIGQLTCKYYKNAAFYFSGWGGFQETGLFVSGTVKMWGDVVEHEAGYRAQYAKLNSIDAIHGVGDTSLAYLRKRYQV